MATDVLDDLTAAGFTVTLEAGKVVITGTASGDLRGLLEVARNQRDVIVARLLGAQIGHPWARCTACGEGSLVAAVTSKGQPRSTWPRCRMTPACEGRHVPHDDDVALAVSRRLSPPPQAQAPPQADTARLLGPVPRWPTEVAS